MTVAAGSALATIEIERAPARNASGSRPAAYASEGGGTWNTHR
jgi:hypothetical protein